jgi:hypothetical protein
MIGSSTTWSSMKMNRSRNTIETMMGVQNTLGPERPKRKRDRDNTLASQRYSTRKKGHIQVRKPQGNRSWLACLTSILLQHHALHLKNYQGYWKILKSQKVMPAGSGSRIRTSKKLISSSFLSSVEGNLPIPLCWEVRPQLQHRSSHQ